MDRRCSWLRYWLWRQAIDDPQKLAGENNHLSSVLGVRGDVAMTLGIIVKADRASEETGHCFLFGGGELCISERAGRDGLAILFGWPEGVAHKVRAVVLGSEFTSVSDGYLPPRGTLQKWRYRISHAGTPDRPRWR